MDPMTGLAIAGVGSSLLGGLFGSSSASKQAAAEREAAREARQMKIDKDAEAQFFVNKAYYGTDAAIRMFRERYGQDAVRFLGEKAADPTFSDEDRARYDALGRVVDSKGFERTDRPLTQAERARAARPGNSRRASSDAAARASAVEAARMEREALFRKAGGRVGTTGLFNVDAMEDSGPGLIDQLRQMTGRRKMANQSLLADARGIEDGIAAYGRQEEERIRRDAERQAQGLARVSRASMMGRGLGAGTAMTDVLERGNRSILESQNDQLGRVADNRIRMMTAAKGDTLNLGSSLLDKEFQFESQPIQAEMGLATSQINNPWLGVNTTQYVSSASPSAAGGATWGNLFAAQGGQLQSLGMMGLLGNRGGSAGGGNVPNAGLNSLLTQQPGPTGIYATPGF